MPRFLIPLSGLTCTSCVTKVRDSLNKKHRVKILEISKNFVEIETDTSLNQIVNTISETGYFAGHHYQMHLFGLSCDSCVKKLTEHISNIEKIISFDVSKTMLSIQTLFTEKEVIELVNKIGYEAKIDASITEQPKKKHK